MAYDKNKSKAQDKIDKYQELVGGRRNFESYWQTLHDYYYVESQDVNRSYAPGTELNADYLYDSTTLEAADILASGFMNYLTPPTSKWFRLRAKNPQLSEDKEVSDFLEDVTDEIYHTLNKGNFYDQAFPSYKASGVYGTSILMEEEDVEENARFLNLPIKQVCILEDTKGRVIEYYIEFEYTAYQAMTRWGKEKLSKELQEELERRTETKHKFLLVIGQRYDRDTSKSDRLNMPIEAVWIDVKARTTMDEGGYNEMPAMTHRFDKRPFIPWGFSPAMKALPFSRLLNAVAKTNLRMMMKHTDPPIAVPDNAFLMPFNANPRAVNYYNKKVMSSGADMFAFGNYGEPKVGVYALEYYSAKVKSLMYNDVFLAFEGLTKQMNNPEVMERINEKMTLLGPAVGRYTGEILNPVIIRTIGILFRRGVLPPIPDALIEDPQYEIDYVSQLAQAQKRSQLNSLVTALTMAGQMAQFAPEVLDKIHPDKTIDEVWTITGAPVRVLRDDDEILKIREGRAAQAAKVQQMEMIGAGASIAETASKADANMAAAEKEVKE
jgi:hypothetical protein